MIAITHMTFNVQSLELPQPKGHEQVQTIFPK